MTHRKIALKKTPAPGIGAVVSAPPILMASDHTIEYTCWHCGTVLLHAEERQVHNVTIHCMKCGSYNSTDV